jgi:hypothetical protein
MNAVLNIQHQHPTSNIEVAIAYRVGVGVGCWMFVRPSLSAVKRQRFLKLPAPN